MERVAEVVVWAGISNRAEDECWGMLSCGNFLSGVGGNWWQVGSFRIGEICKPSTERNESRDPKLDLWAVLGRDPVEC